MPLQFIHITATYSNAVLTAILPHLSDCAQKLDLPIPLPITASQVQKSFPCYIKGYVMGSVTLTNGYWFSFDQGYVSGFRCPNNPFEAEAYGNWQAFVGVDNMTTNDAIQMARDSFRKLGYQPEKFHLDATPSRVEGPNTYEIQGVPNSLHHEPYCRVFWDSPESAIQDMLGHRYNISFAIDMQRKQVVGMSLSGRDFVRPMPKVEIEPELEADYRKRMQADNQTNPAAPAASPFAPGGILPAPQTLRHTTEFIEITPAYSNAMLAASLPLVSEFAEKLRLPISQPITFASVIGSHPSNTKNVFGNTVILTNHFYFRINRGHVDAFGSPDDWFEEKQIRTDWPRYSEKNCLTTNQAVVLARNVFQQLGYEPAKFHMDVPPSTIVFAGDNEQTNIPIRYAYCQISWEGVEGDESNGQKYQLEFDINLLQGHVVGMYLSNTNFWRPDPKIEASSGFESK